MLIPHLIFAHMLGDYVLQSNWLVTRKRQAWSGLVLHGGIIGFVSFTTLIPYAGVVWLPLLFLSALHTGQDFLKITTGPRFNIHPIYPYMGDQLIHYLTIVGVYVWVGHQLSPAPGPREIAFMWTGAAAVAVTRFYEVTWWANWLDMMPYMARWRVFGYAERLAMLALAAAGLWFLTPGCVVPRLVIARRQKLSLWHKGRGALEIGLGVVFSTVLGIGLNLVYGQI